MWSCDIASGTSLVGSYTNDRQTLIFTEMSSIEDSLSETESSQVGSEDEKIKLEGTDGASNRFEDDLLKPYADEPLADKEWLKNYRREQAENEELEKYRVSSGMVAQKNRKIGNSRLRK